MSVNVLTYGAALIGGDLDVGGALRPGSVSASGAIAAGSISATGAASLTGDANVIVIPTSDPGVAGAIWNDGGTLSVSTG